MDPFIDFSGYLRAEILIALSDVVDAISQESGLVHDIYRVQAS
jgi:hypothetical protein